MSLAAGTRPGPGEILSPPGTGGLPSLALASFRLRQGFGGQVGATSGDK